MPSNIFSILQQQLEARALSASGADLSTDEAREVRFVLDFRTKDHTTEAVIRVEDAKGHALRPVAAGHEGATYRLLRALEQAAGRTGIGDSWGWGISYDDDDESAAAIPVSDIPGIHTLLRDVCVEFIPSSVEGPSTIIDSKGESITYSEEMAAVRLEGTPCEGFNARAARTSDGSQGKQGTIAFAVVGPQATGQGNEKGGVPARFVCEDCVLCGDVLSPVSPVGPHFRALSLFDTTIPAAQLPLLLSFFYSYTDRLPVVVDGYSLTLHRDALACQPTLIFERVEEDQALVLRVAQTLGDEGEEEYIDGLTHHVSVEDHHIDVHPIRRATTHELCQRLQRLITASAPSRQAAREVWREGDSFIIPSEVAGEFLVRQLPALASEFRIMGAQRLKAYKIADVRPKLNVKMGSGIDFLEGTADISLGDDTFSLADFLTQFRKHHYILLSDGNRALIDQNYVRRLSRIFQKGKGKDGVRISFFDLPEIENLLALPLDGPAFKRHRAVYEGFNALPAQELKLPKVQATLRDYQKEGVKWINYLYEQQLGGCLADDMGLGKTLQTITQLATVYGRRGKKPAPSLIVMPRSLLFNWQAEFKRFAPQLDVTTHYGTDRNLDEAMKHRIILTTYALVRNDIEQLRQQEFHYVILDESQNIKNLSSQATQAVFLLKAEHRLAISGTPIENNLSELYSLFRFLNPTMFGSLDNFNELYAGPIQRDADAEAMQALRRKIFPFILRRLKRDVLTELPDRIEQTIYVDMTPQHARYYEERRRYFEELVKGSLQAQGIGGSQFVMFQALSELRRMASIPDSLTDGQVASPKLEPLAESLTEAVSNGHKVVVFFNYIAGIELLGDLLTREGISFLTMTGATHNRQHVVETFQNDPSCQVLLMTLKTGGVGLNLTAADTVYIFEPWWNKAAEEQAINRLHRIGQKAKVLSYSIIVRGTIEEKIRLLQEQKQNLFESVVESDTAISKFLSEDDIKFILGS